MLTSCPGIEGLRLFGEGVERVVPGAREILRDPVEAFADLIRRAGGSRSRLLRALEQTQKRPDRARLAQARRRLYDLGVELAGCSEAVRVNVSLHRPPPSDPTKHEIVHVTGHVGFRATDGGMPLVDTAWYETGSDAAVRTLEPRAMDEGEGLVGMLERFCSPRRPRVTTRIVGGRIVQVLRNPAPDSDDTMDIFTAYRFSPAGDSPVTHEYPFIREAMFCSIPARAVVTDVFLHRSLAQRCVPSIGVYRVNRSVPLEIMDRWFDRFPDCPPLEVLGGGIQRVESDLHDRQRDLIEHVSELAGWPPDEFVGFRYAQEYPLWNAEYCVLFDFSERGLE